MGRGKTDNKNIQIMRISWATAHEHVENVRKAYGNAQRAYLIVRALFDGQIALSDLLRRWGPIDRAGMWHSQRNVQLSAPAAGIPPMEFGSNTMCSGGRGREQASGENSQLKYSLKM